ncbi:uncharacterized protein [Clytia hemisphaerica]|uniref:uncharacterized protein n=1 Tax=Clytia hemisphaerica TaxID=252671 RepID=UPI0034D6F765
MPAELQLIISRNVSSEKQFDLLTLLKTFKNELESREKISTNTSSCLQEFTGSSLLGLTQKSSRHDNTSSRNSGRGGNEKKQCVFSKRNHREQYCDIVKDKEVRKSIIIKEKRFFCCFKIGHSSQQCRTNIKCFVCKRKHHVTICMNNEQDKNESSPTLTKEKEKDTSNNKKEEKEEGVSCVAAGSKRDHVFLQTATASVSSETKEQKMRILFDLGSQISYITPKAAKSIDLKPTATKDICITSFDDNSTNKTLNVFKFTVKGKNCEIPVTALCNEICHPLKNQNIDSVSEIPEFASLKFADSNPKNSPLVVDILIGADNYWRFFNDHKVKNSKGTLVAIDTKLGYVLSGSIDKNPLESNVLTTHVLECQYEIRESNTNLQKTLNKFWDSENVQESIDEIKSAAIENFENDISFNEEAKRYEVSLPFLEQYEILNNNYENSKHRLKSVLLKHFKSNEKLLETYDTIIKEQIELGVIEEVPTPPPRTRFIYRIDQCAEMTVLLQSYNIVRKYPYPDSCEIPQSDESHTIFSDGVEVPNLLGILDPRRFGSLTRLLRVTAKVLRFVRNLKQSVQNTKLNKRHGAEESIDHMVDAKKLWILEVQKEFSSSELNQLKRNLNVFTDDHGILRCKGRLGNAPLPFDTKFPILIPRNSRLAELIVLKSHKNVGHNKTKDTLNELRSQYWIPKGRQLIKKLMLDLSII